MSIRVQRDVTRRIADTYGIDDRTGRLTLVHLAATAVNQALLSPLAFDGVGLTVSAGQIGPVLNDTGEVTGVWVGSVADHRMGGDPLHVGATAWTLLAPIGERVRRAAGVGEVAMKLLMYEALELECLRLERLGAEGPGRGWVERLLQGAAFAPRTPRREVAVAPDDGPVVGMPVRRICCVLSREATPDACPTCPQYTTTQRMTKTTSWLRELGGADFEAVVGRGRVANRSSATP